LRIHNFREESSGFIIDLEEELLSQELINELLLASLAIKLQ
jgi:hypothetical protein